jgi:hypothetical protein
MGFVPGFFQYRFAAVQYLLALTGIALMRGDKSDLAVLVLMVIPVHKSLNPLPDISQIFKAF